MCTKSIYISIINELCVLKSTGGRTGRTDRAEGRTDRAEGPGGRTGRKDRAEGRKDPPPPPPTPHPPPPTQENHETHVFLRTWKRCAAKVCKGCTERQLQIIDMVIFGANCVFKNL